MQKYLMNNTLTKNQLGRRNDMTYKLYYAPHSAAAGVRVLLEEIGMSYELIETTTDRSKPRPPEHMALNPNGWVPVLFIQTVSPMRRRVKIAQGPEVFAGCGKPGPLSTSKLVMVNGFWVTHSARLISISKVALRPSVQKVYGA